MLNKTLERVYRKLQGYLISRFNKYPRNPRNFLSSKLIRPTVNELLALLFNVFILSHCLEKYYNFSSKMYN